MGATAGFSRNRLRNRLRNKFVYRLAKTERATGCGSNIRVAQRQSQPSDIVRCAMKGGDGARLKAARRHQIGGAQVPARLEGQLQPGEDAHVVIAG